MSLEAQARSFFSFGQARSELSGWSKPNLFRQGKECKNVETTGIVSEEKEYKSKIKSSIFCRQQQASKIRTIANKLKQTHEQTKRSNVKDLKPDKQQVTCGKHTLLFLRTESHTETEGRWRVTLFRYMPTLRTCLNTLVAILVSWREHHLWAAWPFFQMNVETFRTGSDGVRYHVTCVSFFIKFGRRQKTFSFSLTLCVRCVRFRLISFVEYIESVFIGFNHGCTVLFNR